MWCTAATKLRWWSERPCRVWTHNKLQVGDINASSRIIVTEVISDPMPKVQTFFWVKEKVTGSTSQSPTDSCSTQRIPGDSWGFLRILQDLWEHQILTFFLHDIVAPCLPLFIKMYIACIGKYNSTWNHILHTCGSSHHILHTCGSSHHSILPLDEVSSPLWDTRAPRWVIASLSQGHRKPNAWLHYPESLLQDLVASHNYSPPSSQQWGLVEKPIANAGFHNGGSTVDFIKMKSLGA